jgi:hypothetical protein
MLAACPRRPLVALLRRSEELVGRLLSRIATRQHSRSASTVSPQFSIAVSRQAALANSPRQDSDRQDETGLADRWVGGRERPIVRQQPSPPCPWCFLVLGSRRWGHGGDQLAGLVFRAYRR